jgi:hypothetical protein
VHQGGATCALPMQRILACVPLRKPAGQLAEACWELAPRLRTHALRARHRLVLPLHLGILHLVHCERLAHVEAVLDLRTGGARDRLCLPKWK